MRNKFYIFCISLRSNGIKNLIFLKLHGDANKLRRLCGLRNIVSFANLEEYSPLATIG